MDTTTKKKKHVSGVTVVSYVVLALLSLSAILPFVLMFTSSISSEESITRNGYSFIPSEFRLAPTIPQARSPEASTASVNIA